MGNTVKEMKMKKSEASSPGVGPGGEKKSEALAVNVRILAGSGTGGFAPVGAPRGAYR